jgi:hypothetical protein
VPIHFSFHHIITLPLRIPPLQTFKPNWSSYHQPPPTALVMSDSPLVRAPLDPKEQPVLDSLLAIRTQLELMKQDKSCFVKTDAVMRLYRETNEQVNQLNKLRTINVQEQNRVDTVLDDCYQLLSLAFMVLGKNAEAPAIYSIVSTIKRLLDHLKEAAFYSPKDLEMCAQQLKSYRKCIENERDTADPNLVQRLDARISLCEQELEDLGRIFDRVPADLMPAYERLVSILRSLSACNLKSKVPHPCKCNADSSDLPPVSNRRSG